VLSKVRPHLTFANVIACIALFIALGGTSVAAVSLSKNTVGSKQLKAGAVHNSDLSKNAVTSTKIANGSLQTTDFKGGQLPAGARGPQGAVGTTGSQGSSAASFQTGRFDFGVTAGVFAAPTGVTASSSTESDLDTLSPAQPSVARDLAINETTALTGDNTRTYTLRVNGTDTALTCSITSANTICHDTTHTVTIPAGSLLSIRAGRISGSGSSGGATGSNVRFGWRATTP
jgi:hypothetical protein